MKNIQKIIQLICINWKKDGKKNIRLVIYNLIYPAILGSMIYDLFSIRWNEFFCYYMKIFFIEPRYIMSIAIVLFYLFDYYYLYTFMDKEYLKEQKKERSYIYGDVLISFCLLIAFKAYKYSPVISYLFLVCIPILFLWNSCTLEKGKNKKYWQSTSNKFDKLFALIFYLVGGIIYISGLCIPGFDNCSKLAMAYFILLMVFTYGIYALYKTSSKKPYEIADFDEKEYKINNIEKFNEIFKKIE